MQKNLKKAVWLTLGLSFALGISVSIIQDQSKAISQLEHRSHHPTEFSIYFDSDFNDQMADLREELKELEEIKEEQMEELQKELEVIREEILEDLHEIRLDHR